MPNIKKNFLYSSFLTTANYIFPLLTYPYVSRVLGVTNIGICNFVDSIIQYFILFSMMGINIVGIREIAACNGNRHKLSKAFNSLFWLNTITTIIALIILSIAVVTVNQLREHWDMMAVGAMKLLTNFMLVEWLYKGLEEFKFITIRTIIVKLAYVASVFIFVQNQDDYVVYYLLTVLMVAINAFVNLVYSRNFIFFSIHVSDIRKYTKQFFLLGIYGLLTSMYTTFNVAYLGFVAGETEVGYYTTASKFFHILIALFTAFTGVMLPRMSSLLSEGKIDEFKKYLTKSVEILFIFSIPVIIVTTIYAPIIIKIVAGEGYEGAALPMRIIMPLILIIGYEQIIIIQGLMPLKQDKAILRNSIAGALVGIILNVALVSSFKSVGSSIVWIVSEIVVLISAQYYIGKAIGIKFPHKQLKKWIAINLPLTGIVVGIYMSPLGNLWSSFVAGIICIVYFAVTQFFIPNDVVVGLVNRVMKKG